jgi:predicted dehydrogenase
VSDKLKFGIVGLVHDHVWPVWNEGYIRQLAGLDGVEIAAAADPHRELLERVTRDFGIQKTYRDYREMIRREKLDAVLMALPNDEKADATELLAAEGIHILMDKPMAATLHQADRIYRAASNAGIKLLVNWPCAWNPSIHKAFSLVRQGVIGNVFEMKAGVSNPGPENHGCSKYFLEWLFSREKNGGGALIDYCCYGVAFALTVFGTPKRVVGIGGRYVKENIITDDNAWVVMEYGKAHAISTGSWSQYGADGNEDFFPDNQKVFFGGDSGAIMVKWFENDVHLISPEHPKGATIAAEPLKPGEDNGPAYFVKCIREDRLVEGMVNPKLCRDVQEVMEAAYISINTGSKVNLPLKGGKS